MTLYIFISIDMNQAFCHFYDKNSKRSLLSLKNIQHTIQKATHTHILIIQDQFPFERHMEKSCGGDLQFLNLTLAPANNFTPYSILKQFIWNNHTGFKYCKTIANTSSKL